LGLKLILPDFSPAMIQRTILRTVI